MGERALAARHGRSGRYELYRCQWAETGRLVDAAVCGQCPVTETEDPSAESEWDRCGRAHWSELIDELDYLALDLCVRCDPDAVGAYLPVWLGIPTGEHDETEPTCGALLRIESRADLSRLRGRIRRSKERLGEAIERGLIERREARRSLLAVAGSRERYLSASASDCFGPSE